MPKNKTHSGAKKRFRVTGSGKLTKKDCEEIETMLQNWKGAD